MKIGLIYQPCGLGDILFLQKLAHTMKNEGYTVYWPVLPEYISIQKNIPFFNFMSWDDSTKYLTRPPLPEHVKFPYKEQYLPETPSHKTDDFWFFQGFGNHNPVMSGKYTSIGMDWRDWRDWINFEREMNKEDDLFYNVLGLTDDVEYCVTNHNYGASRSNNLAKFSNKTELPIVEVNHIDGFSAFDWLKVFENATEISMIETSFNYLLETSPINDIIAKKKLNLYSRRRNFSAVDYLFDLPWTYNTG
jgi:hypothetical protein